MSLRRQDRKRNARKHRQSSFFANGVFWGYQGADGRRGLRIEPLEERRLLAVDMVTSGLDDGSAGTLRSVIAASAAGDTVEFSLPSGTTKIDLTQGQIEINKDLTIQGPTASSLTIDQTTNAARLFLVDATESVSMSGFTITGANGANTYGAGIQNNGKLTLNSMVVMDSAGGLVNQGTATISNSTFSNIQGEAITNNNALTLTGSTLSGNHGGAGGAIQNNGTLSIDASTISDNTATGSGGAIFSTEGGTTTISDSTLAGNSASGSGGAIDDFAATVILEDCTISQNSATSGGGISIGGSGTVKAANTIIAGNTGGDLSGTLAVSDDNLIGGDPKLAPLANYGGATQTMPPLPGSPVIDAGDNSPSSPFAVTPATDERGAPRVANGIIDIGAVETQPTLYVATSFYDQTTGAATSLPKSGDVVNWLASGQFQEVDSLIFGISAFSTIQSAVTMANAVGGNTVDVAAGTYDESVTIDEPLTLQGAVVGATTAIQASSTGAGTGLTLSSTTGTVTVDGLAITDFALGVSVLHGTVALDSDIISDNANGIANGGGIYNAAMLSLNDDTISGNAAGLGAGIFSDINGNLTISDSTSQEIQR